MASTDANVLGGLGKKWKSRNERLLVREPAKIIYMKVRNKTSPKLHRFIEGGGLHTVAYHVDPLLFLT